MVKYIKFDEHSGGFDMKNKRKKLVLIIICCIASALTILGGIILFTGDNKQDFPEDILPDFSFYPPNYDIDILEDPEYLSLNRDISYIKGAVTVTVKPDEYSSTDIMLQFLSEYINTLINGDYEGYPMFFSDEYKEKNSLPEKFTMQRIHNILIEKISEEKSKAGNTLYVYMLDYQISLNNGTLRRDMDSDSSRPQFLVIKEENGEYKIDNIITYYNQE